MHCSFQWLLSKTVQSLNDLYLSRFPFLSLPVCRAVKFSAKLMGQAMAKRVKATILFATETGKSQDYAKTLCEIFKHAFDAKVRLLPPCITSPPGAVTARTWKWKKEEFKDIIPISYLYTPPLPLVQLRKPAEHMWWEGRRRQCFLSHVSSREVKVLRVRGKI